MRFVVVGVGAVGGVVGGRLAEHGHDVRPPTAETPIVCLHNGVDNERQALRRFPRVEALVPEP